MDERTMDERTMDERTMDERTMDERTMDERTMDDISAGPDRPASVNETEQAPFSSPWTRPPRPPEG
jgi:hypothetical protein